MKWFWKSTCHKTWKIQLRIHFGQKNETKNFHPKLFELILRLCIFITPFSILIKFLLPIFQRSLPGQDFSQKYPSPSFFKFMSKIGKYLWSISGEKLRTNGQRQRNRQTDGGYQQDLYFMHPRKGMQRMHSKAN